MFMSMYGHVCAQTCGRIFVSKHSNKSSVPCGSSDIHVGRDIARDTNHHVVPKSMQLQTVLFQPS